MQTPTETLPQVLLVDDRPENLLALESILGHLPCRLVKATSGQEALRLALKQELALILLDVQMPGMNGFELAELLRGRQQTRHVPIIFVTAISKEAAYVFKGYEVGAVDYLFKPLDPDILRGKVRVFLELDRQRQALRQQAHALEDKTRALETEIAHRRQIEAELQQAKEAAETANRAKSVFLAGMSHELRTPLNGILGYTQTLRRDPKLTEEQRDAVHWMQTSGEQLLLVINDLLDMAQIEAQKLELRPAGFDFLALLHDVVTAAQERARQKALTWRAEIAPEVPRFVIGDATRLRQILMNLLSNAVKFTAAGEVTLRVESLTMADGRLATNQHDDKQSTIRFEVQDTGIGIPAEHIPEIFRPFEQIGEPRLQAEGTGLGLAITRQLVRMMGGELTVRSVVGAGSVFAFALALPLMAGAATDLPPDASFSSPEPPDAVITPPAREELTALLDCALQGDVFAIRDRLRRLEASDAALTPFVHALRALAADLLIDEMQRFLQRFLA